MFSKSLIPTLVANTSQSTILESPLPEGSEMERLAAFGGGGPRGIIAQCVVPLPKEATLMDEEIQELVSLAEGNSMDTSTTSSNLDIDGEKTLKRSNQTLAKAFFPSPTTSATSTSSTKSSKRLSLPLVPSTSQTSMKSNPSTKTTRKSLSPRNARRTSLQPLPIGTATSLSAASGSLLLPLASQLHTLKARNTALEKSLAAEKLARTSELHKAMLRIQGLVKAVEGGEAAVSRSEKLKMEKDGWESEVGLLRGELEEAKVKLEETRLAKVQVEEEKRVEAERRAKSKLLVERLRLELKSRKAKEKWEAAIMDLEDSEREKAEVARDFEENMAKCERVILNCEIQELELAIASQGAIISSLRHESSVVSAHSSTHIAAITAVKLELASVKSELGTTRKQAKEATSAKGKMEKRVEELEKEAKDGKDVEEVEGRLVEEKRKRGEKEDELKELKATLKSTQTSLTLATKSLASLTKTVEKQKLAPLPSVAVLAARKRRSMTTEGSDPAYAPDDIEEDSLAADSSLELPKKKVKTTQKVAAPAVETKVRKVKKAERIITPAESEVEEEIEEELVADAVEEESEEERDAAPVEEEEEEATQEEVYKPVKSKSRLAPMPKVLKEVKEKKSSRPRASIGTSGAISEDVPKKRKSSTAPTATLKVLETKISNGATTSLEVEEGGKKKKRKLAPKKYEWGGIENANINGSIFGIPSNLSPIKSSLTAVGGLASMFGRTGGAAGRSIF